MLRPDMMGESGMTARSRGRHLLISVSFTLLGTVGVLADVTTNAVTTNAQLLAAERTIEISGEAGRESETRTIRFRTSNRPTIEFEPSNLARTSPQGLRPAIIDSGQVRITPAPPTKAPGPGFATFELTVTYLPERYGVFSGSIDIRVEGEKTEKIDIKLTVRPSASLALSPEPKSVSLQDVPSWQSCQSAFRHCRRECRSPIGTTRHWCPHPGKGRSRVGRSSSKRRKAYD
jgi:hypothetical protein